MRAIVTDVEMPGSLDGFTFTRIVKQAWPHIGIVVMSGRSHPDPGVLPEGALFLTKPTGADALLEVVRSLIGPPPRTRTGASLPVLPAAIKIDRPHTGIGSEGGLAQPLSEPEK